ncbi:hypothetical protein VB713_24115 [Anabaena cylindrica UHCC 0172]|uniref:hypothetical protein n=1 Tax=Anabaena cylindrica TaxID=1165 RepID=UPI002B1FC4AC|nr:hypothetical protein [Anabaena cylindrica]MEA5554029.1 hypothetical protein [Anabaena cylindrica UHCC 0172]
MSQWAAIVYGRTYEIDFRFLALPHDFERAEQDWAMAHIQVMTRSPEDLPGKPRWAVFKNNRLCVIGVACSVINLIDQVKGNEEDLTRDQRGRPLFVFVGYATRLDQEQIELPAYLNQDLSLFRYPYEEYVSANWRAKSYEERSRIAISTEYQPLSYPTVIIPPDLDQEYFALNQAEDEAVYLWCDTQEERHYLWIAAALQICEGNNASLCLGLALRSDTTNGAFFNATATDVSQKEKIARVKKAALVPLPESVPELREPALNQQVTTGQRRPLNFLILQLGGVFIGVFIGLLLAKLLRFSLIKIAIYFFGGGVVGWILVIISYFLTRKISSQHLARSLNNSDNSDASNHLSSEDKMLGFKEKAESDQTEEDEFMGWK